MGTDGAASTFTIPDTTGTLTEFLIGSGAIDPVFREIRPRLTYHLVVKSTRNGSDSVFSMDSAQFERVSECAA
jgi:hypothetical protein